MMNRTERAELNVANQMKILSSFSNLKAVILMLPLFFYPPFVFGSKIPEDIRITAFLLLISYLCIMSLSRETIGSRKFIMVLVFIIFLAVSVFLNSLNLNEQSDLRTFGNLFATFIFAFFLFWYLDRNDEKRNLILITYSYLFEMISVMSFLSALYFVFRGTWDLFGFEWDGITDSVYTYKATPFGLLLTKTFFDIEVIRSCFFFIEPNYLGFFYAFNLIFISSHIGKNLRRFVILNLSGGILTFSFTFFLVLICGYIIREKRLLWRQFIIICAGILLMYLFYIYLVDYSSFEDRLYRAGLYNETLSWSNLKTILFGHGFISIIHDSDVHFSMGILAMFYEIGYFHALLVLIYVYIMSRKDIRLFIIGILGLMLFEVTKLPLFWFGLILANKPGLFRAQG